MLVKEMKDHLNNIIIPFWKSMKDNKNGSYYGFMDYNLQVDDKAVKGCILNSRILWFFSSAYGLLGGEDLLQEANHAYEYMKAHCLDKENGGIYWSTNYDGSIHDQTKHTYNQAFAIYALSTYYEYTRDEEALQLALSIYHVIETHCKDEGGYGEAYDEAFQPISNEKLSENGIIATRTMNTLLHVFEAYTQLYKVTKDEKIGDNLRWMLDTIETKIYNPSKKRQEVFFDDKYNSLIDLHSYGHDIETAWLIDRGCEVLGDQCYTKKMEVMTKELTQNIYQIAYRKHSLDNECEDGIVNTSRIWWVQAEAVVGFWNGYEKDSSRMDYKEAALDIWEYIKEYMIDKRCGSEWYWEVDEDGNPTSRKPIVEPWKCPYHNGRMCIEIIRRNTDVA